MAALTLTDLDDFLTPSQACIIPVRSSNKPAGNGDPSSTEIVIDANNNYYEVSTYSTAPTVGGGARGGEVAGRQALKKAEISLNDCLACSGCITSTESLLITMQSHNEVLAYIRAGDFSRTPILSIAPQTLASLSTAYAEANGTAPVPLLVMLRRIRHFLAAEERGAWRVWDTTFARHVSLRETVREFVERRDAASSAAPLPMLTSACPGWVCYAEKAQGDLLPLLSAARSAQGVMGSLAKTWYAGKLGRTPGEVYHVSAMMCYDKKLEAARPDFAADHGRDTDCVLTTGELDLLLSELGFDPLAHVPGENASVEDDPETASPFPQLLDHPGSSSGSYLATLLYELSAAHAATGGRTRIHSRLIRGSTDNEEVFLEDADTGAVLFKGAKCYGFRNLQNLVRKVGRESGLGKAGLARGAGKGKLQAAVAARRRRARERTTGTELSTPGTVTPGSPAMPDTRAPADIAAAAGEAARDEKKFDFVEVMACPSGCVNGGGQMKPVGISAKASAESTTSAPRDTEGFPIVMAPDGTDGTVAAPPTRAGLSGLAGADEGLRWSTKAWVSKVEAVYWEGLPTPQASRAGSPDGERPADGPSELPFQPPLRTLAANAAADKIVQSLVADVAPHAHSHPPGQCAKSSSGACQGSCGSGGDANGHGNDHAHEETHGHEKAPSAAQTAEARYSVVRTRFRRVEGDVLSNGGLTHEQVKW